MNLKHYVGAISAIDRSTKIMTMKFVSIASISILTVACSSSGSQFDSPELLPADEMKAGPGFFSGSDGSYTALGDKKPSVTTTVTESSLEGKDLQQTSELLDEKIKQSQRNTIELELLKRQVDKKLKTN